MDVPDYATVSFLSFILFFVAKESMLMSSGGFFFIGPRYTYRSSNSVRHRGYHPRSRVHPFSSSLPLSSLLILIHSSRNHGSHFEKHRAAFLEGAANDDAVIDDDDDADVVARRGGAGARAGVDGAADQPDSGRDSGSVVDEKNEKV